MKYIPSDYVEKLNLQIPENMRKLLSDVILVLLEKSGIDRNEAKKVASYIERADKKGRKGMFEAAIESIIKERKAARRQGMKKGLQQGIQAGEQKIINLLKNGRSPEEIIRKYEDSQKSTPDIQE